MTALHRYRLEITLAAPYLSQSSSAAAFGLDAPVARDHEGRPIVPSTLIAGHLSHAWRAWSQMGVDEADNCLRWLGESSDEAAGSYEPRRKSLFIDDLTGADPGGNHTLQRIRIDSARGAVDQGALMVAEQPWAPGGDLVFGGNLRFYGDQTEAENMPKALRAALNWAGQLGAERGIGFGEIKQIRIEGGNAAAIAENPPRPTPDGRELPLALAFDRPFCLAESNLDNNLFAGIEVIPGAALKGALADAWARLLGKPAGSPVVAGFDPARPHLSRHYDSLAFSHAMPGQAGRPAVVAPLSLVKTAAGDFVDLAALNAAPLFDGKAPAFAPDWKDQDAARVGRHFGWPNLDRDLRVRTAIDLETGRARDEQLFAYESVVPGAAVRWYAAIRPQAPSGVEQAALMAELTGLIAALGQELGPLGKTKAFARVMAGVARPDAIPARPDGLWIVTLQTPALLGDWRELDECADADEMARLYRAYFDEASSGALGLIRHFARQRLAGGRYLHQRFRKGQPYRPWLLTEAGSVFVLQANDGNAQTTLETWLRDHLPSPRWLKPDGDMPAWRAIPYLPEGGYGRIAVNLDCHDGAPLALDPQ